MRSFFFLVAGLILTASLLWAAPLKDLGLLGEKTQERFESQVEKTILPTLQEKGLYQAAKLFRHLASELTYWLQDLVGDYQVEVRLYAERYCALGNLAPPEIQKVLEDFKESLKNKDHLWPHIIIQETPHEVFYWYVIPLLMKKSCLPCHGRGNSYQQAFRELYPENLAIDLSLGDLRGALVIKISRRALIRFSSPPSETP